MLGKPKNKQKTVAEKVAESLLHPNESGSDSDSADEATAPRIIEYDDDEYELPQAGTTEFRKRNVKLLSEQSAKYKGKIVSRKDFESDEEEEDDDDEEVYEKTDSSDNEDSLECFSKVNEENNDSEDDDEGDDNEMEQDSASEEEEETVDNEHDDEEDEDDLDSENDEDEENAVISKVNHEAEIQKGLCVQNQLRIWERFLEMRINMQKLLSKSNQLPAPQELKDLECNNEKFKDLQQTTTKQTCLLLQNLLALKTNLCNQFPEINKALKPSLKRPFPFKDHNSCEPPFKQISQYLHEGFENFESYRNTVLLKWDDRTKLLQAGAGTKKKSLKEYDVIKKINNALINKSQLKEKSQMQKTAAQNEVGEELVRNPNIYDDSEFYHQQLRELIDSKAHTTSNISDVTKLLELQKLRQKMKKKVDTRASKGRKLRYGVHNKLINWMAPHENTTFTKESIDELSKCLFV